MTDELPNIANFHGFWRHCIAVTFVVRNNYFESKKTRKSVIDKYCGPQFYHTRNDNSTAILFFFIVVKVNALFILQTTLSASHVFDPLNGVSEKIMYEEWHSLNKFKLVRLEQFWDRWIRLDFCIKRTKIDIDTKSFTCKIRAGKIVTLFCEHRERKCILFEINHPHFCYCCTCMHC